MERKAKARARGGHSSVKKEVQTVQCALCKTVTATSAFPVHNLDKHNMLSWIEGETPLDLNNEKLVLSILNKALKSKKKKVLLCEVCGEEKKSAVGFFTHKQVCGKSEEEIEQLRITCEVCGKTVMPVSLRSHMLIHQRRSAASEDLENTTESSMTNPGSSRGDGSGKKMKRAAAARAKSRMIAFLSDDGLPTSMKSDKQSQVISDFETSGWDESPRLQQTWKGFLSLTGVIMCVYNGCPYQADSIDSMRNHLADCDFSRDHDMRFLCNVCLQQCCDESEMDMHVQTQHESKDSVLSAEVNSYSDRDSASDPEMESPRIPVKRQNRQTCRPKLIGAQRALNKMRFLQNTSTNLGKDLEIYPAALDWTFDFRMANYMESVYPTFIPLKRDLVLVQEDTERYIPSTSTSILMEFRSAIQDTSVPPHQFSLFEGQIIDGVSTIFSGGPVWAMEWCPIPMCVCLSEEKAPSEYLAISTHHNMDDKFCVPKCFSFPNIIQFWDCGNLASRSLYQRPKLAFALAHEYGTVWSLAWCPSGAFDLHFKTSDKDKEYMKRMGILAAACSSGNVQIFSIPFPDQLEDHMEKKCLPIYKAQPSLTLITNFTEQSQCTRVTWYQGRGHGLIAAGYCNGMVALWDLVTLPPLLWDAQQCTLKPFQCFQAHLTVISALSFNPEYDGRFFMTGSHDRGVKFWDMEDLSAPMTHHKRGYVTDGVWLNLWISSITSYDDAFQHEHTNSTLHPARDYGYKPYPLLTQNSVAWCLSYNDWINATAQGSEAGEVVVTFSSQLMLGLDNEKNAIDKRIMASYTLLKKLVQGHNGEKQLGEVMLWKPETKSAKGKGKKNTKTSRGKGKRTAVEDEKEDDTAASLYSPGAMLVDRNPQFYKDIEKSYGICVFDTVKVDSNKKKLPEEAKARVRISGKMHPTCSDFYPITSINKISWNPNIGRFFWLATGHQSGIVRITGMHFMENSTTTKFLQRALEAVKQN